MQNLNIPPISNFFNDYHILAKGIEPPDSFQFWSCIYAISTVLGRKTALALGPLKFFPQLYVVIVGPPATKKTTAVNLAQGLVASLGKINFAPSSLSKEALVDALASEKAKVNVTLAGKPIPYHQVACFASELSEFLGGKHLNEHIIRFLTDIWDKDEFKELTRKGGEVVVPSPYFTMIGCCTQDWIGRSLASEIITDGFARRVIFVYDDAVKCIPWPETTPEMVQAKARCKQNLERMFELQGFFNISKEAFALYNEFYIQNRQTINTRPPMMQNYYASKSTLVLKLAMCISAAIRTDLLIDSGCFTAALKCLELTEVKRDSIFNAVGRNQTSVAQDNIVKHLGNKEAKSASKKELLAMFLRDFRDIQEFENTMRLMVEAGILSANVELAPASLMKTEYRLLRSAQQRQDSNPFDLTAHLVPLAEEQVSFGLGVPLASAINPAAVLQADATAQWIADLQQGVLRLGKARKPRPEDVVQQL